MLRFCKLILCVSFALVFSAQAQWVIQEIDLDTGWNAICLKADLPDSACAVVFDGQPVEIVSWWCRSGDGEGGYTHSPDDPIPPAPDMRNWYSTNHLASTFYNLIGGESYLIKATAPTTLQLKGVPALPCPVLFGDIPSLCGFNLPLSGGVMLSEYFDYYDNLGAPLPFSGINSGDASSAPLPPNYEPDSSESIWVSSSGELVLEYSGPFNISVGSGDGVLSFQGIVSPRTLTIRNNANIERVVSITESASAMPPPGQGGLAGAVSLMHAVIDWSAGFPRETYVDFTLPWSTNIAAGAEFELRLLPKVVDMPLSGDAYQSILNITDLGSSDNSAVPGGRRSLYQVGVRCEGDLAEQTQPTGLWVGNVVLDGVNRAQMRTSASNVWDSAAIQTALHPFTFRVILHVDEYGVTRLMKEAFIASVPDVGNSLLASRDAAIAFLANYPDSVIRRISSANFQFMLPKPLSGGSFATADEMLSVTVLQEHDDKTNPFVHAYHPEHDNVKFLNGSVVSKSNGATGIGDYESWAVSRGIEFTFTGNDPVGSNPKWNISVTGGTYEETINGLNKTEIKTRGAFRLNKVSDVSRILYVSGS